MLKICRRVLLKFFVVYYFQGVVGFSLAQLNQILFCYSQNKFLNLLYLCFKNRHSCKNIEYARTGHHCDVHITHVESTKRSTVIK